MTYNDGETLMTLMTATFIKVFPHAHGASLCALLDT